MLADPAARETQARRLLDTPAARAQLTGFVSQWVGIDRIEQADKDKKIFPEWSADVAAKMRQETAAFVQSVVYDGDGMLSTLLTAPYTFVDSTLAQLYGLPPPTEFGKVALDPTQRAGLLTQGSVLATFAQSTQGSPVRRGKLVRVRLLCEVLPDPPKNLVDHAASAQRDQHHARALQSACLRWLCWVSQARGPSRVRFRKLRRHRALPNHRERV